MTSVLIKRGALDPETSVEDRKYEKTQIENGHLQAKQRDLKDPFVTALRKNHPC